MSEDDKSNIISDDELDALFDGGELDGLGEGSDAPAQEASPDADVSQGDIDSLLDGIGSGGDGVIGGEASVGQDDIDALLGGGGEGISADDALGAAAGGPDMGAPAPAAPAPAAEQAPVAMNFDPNKPMGDQLLQKLPDLEGLFDLKLNVEVVYGETKRPLLEMMKLTEGETLDLEKVHGHPLDVYVNGMFFARGDAVVVNRRFSVKIKEVVSLKERVDRLKILMV